MKRIANLSVLSIAALMLFATVASAQPGDHIRKRAKIERRGGPMGGPPMEMLDLTEAQHDQIHKISIEAKKKRIDLNAKMQLARIELHELMAADNPDKGKIDEQISKIGKLHEMKLRNQIESTLEKMKVLTPEQRQKMKELRRTGRHHPRGRGPGMGLGMGFGFEDDADEVEVEVIRESQEF